MLERKVAINEEQVRTFLSGLFEEDLHAKRVLSLSHATLGVVHAAFLSVNAIGQALAWARGTRHGHLGLGPQSAAARKTKAKR